MNSTHAIRAAVVGVLLLAATAIGCGGSGGGGGDRGGAALAAPAAPQEDPGTGTGDPNTGAPGGVSGSTGAAGEDAFTQTVFPLTRQYCVQCHAGAGPGFPHIAHPDPGTAYRAVVDNQKVNLAIPVNSRVVQRLVADRHFCWNDCDADGVTMEAAVTQWAGLVATAPTDPGGGTGNPGAGNATIISSFANDIANSVKADSTRYETDNIALYRFKEGSGDTAFDDSVVPPRMDLTLEGNVTWVNGGGIEFIDGKLSATQADSMKIYNELASGSGTHEYSIEAWVIPANTTQEGPARIISYSNGTSNRNFALGQVLYNYNFRNRSMALGIGPNGTPALQTADADEDLQATLQHVVITFDQRNGRQIYVNGRYTDDMDNEGPGLLTNWNQDYRFVLGNETSNNRQWNGQLKLVAIFNKVLTPAQIQQNYLAGAVDKFLLRFGLDDWLDAGSYVEFEVSEFDSYSYLFCFPTVSTGMQDVQVSGLRVAVNGTPPVQSQSFRNVGVTMTQGLQRVSNLCSVVPKAQGATGDMFSIWFDVLGGTDKTIVEAPPVVPPNNEVADPMPGIGIRSFEQVNDTMAELTGIDPNSGTVKSAFTDLKQQLPPGTDIRSFVSSHQVAISKLSLEYCDAMVESSAARTAFFGPGFDFNAAVPTAFANQAQRDMIVNALIDGMFGISIANQPTAAETAPLLNTLIDDLTVGCSAATCPAERTRTVVKGLCSAALSSAAIHIY